jgi:methylamine dehydrogenase light chain
MNSCPPGTEPSPVTWIGTCRNEADGRDYVISYNDCCGKSACGRCTCTRNEGDRPVYQPSKSNDINWCLGTTTNVYHCSTAVVIGLALE